MELRKERFLKKMLIKNLKLGLKKIQKLKRNYQLLKKLDKKKALELEKEANEKEN